LREKIVKNDYKPRNCNISADEIFISDGAKCDTGNIQEIFSTDNLVALTDPVYPVYIDTNVMAGRTGEAKDNGQYESVVYMPCVAENNFVPAIPDKPVDLIYLCYPNNPTGATATKEQLKKWVDYAKEHKAIILFDAAYEAFIRDENIPHSIYEIDGAREVAIEFRSFSKTAGFTGTRCAFTVVPKDLKGYTKSGETVDIHSLWNRRHSTKFNGASYISQVGASAIYSEKGKKQIRDIINLYMSNADYIKEHLKKQGYTVYGGDNSPYIWLKTPKGTDSWKFFDLLLKKANVVGTPGVGFGPSGEGYFRLTAFAQPDNVKEAIKRIEKI
jgi:LL-diaminopimelate aminotransferase